MAAPKLPQYFVMTCYFISLCAIFPKGTGKAEPAFFCLVLLHRYLVTISHTKSNLNHVSGIENLAKQVIEARKNVPTKTKIHFIIFKMEITQPFYVFYAK